VCLRRGGVRATHRSTCMVPGPPLPSASWWLSAAAVGLRRVAAGGDGAGATVAAPRCTPPADEKEIIMSAARRNTLPCSPAGNDAAGASVRHVRR
jgi:hypothetical protein